MGRLQGKVAVVTGAGQGIGAGIARAFAREGAAVIAAEINPESGAKIEKELRALEAKAIFVETDVGDRESIRSMISAAFTQFGHVDILVNNAQGLTPLARVEDKTDEQFDRSLRTGLYGTLWAMQEVYPSMRKQGWGRIINMASLNGINAHKFSADYNATKESIRALSRTAAAEWGVYGITVNVIAPAAATPAYNAFEKADPESAAAICKTIPLRRMGDPDEDIAPVAVFLSSDDARYVTGNTIYVDGGGHINGVPWSPPLPESSID
jgi:NAD(P)-dependent dehydrogenase (short-subunit alcohol dehydrogenase family)